MDSAATVLDVRLFGTFACRTATGGAIAFSTRKVRALFAYLAATAGECHARDKLARLLWDEHGDAEARANLRKTLSRLRTALPDEARACLTIEPGFVGFRPDGLEVDVRAFDRLAADGTPETLERAVLLHRGLFLEGFPDCGEAFDEWLSAERRRLDETLHGVLQRLLDHEVVTGAIERAILVALRLLSLDPLQESVHRGLIRLYMYQDRIGAALEQYRRCREVLANELGVEPAPETERIGAELLKLVPAGETDLGPERERDALPERATVLGAAYEARLRRRAELIGRPSIAVLTFAVGDAAYRHLGDGMAEDIATELGRFSELDVIAPATALAYRDLPVPPQRVGLELGVAYVLEGRLRLAGERARISVRLIESASARQLWAERYDCAQAGILDVQDEVVRHIVGTLVGRIEDARLAAAKRTPPSEWQAYDLWLRGWCALRRPDSSAIGEARKCFREAIAIDPHFARGYVGLALAHLNEWACLSWNHWVFPQEEVLELARKAVELDERDHRAHCIQGVTEIYAGDDESARRRLLRALELNPNDADVLAHVSWALAILGDVKRAVELGRSALRLAPHHPEWYAAFVGITLFNARLYEEAIQTMAPAPEALCNTPAFIAASYAHLGEIERCAGYRETVHRHFRRQLARGMFPTRMSCIDWLLAMDPFRRPADAEHYTDGLRQAGFE